jgi:hypothetical protein
VCDRSDQAAHYHNLGPKLGASLLTRHIGWKQKKKERKKEKKCTEDPMQHKLETIKVYFHFFTTESLDRLQKQTQHCEHF